MDRKANILVSILWVITSVLDIVIFFVNTVNIREKVTMAVLFLYSSSVAYEGIRSIVLGTNIGKNIVIFRLIVGIISIIIQSIVLIRYFR
mgnify:CR=1 FL=1